MAEQRDAFHAALEELLDRIEHFDQVTNEQWIHVFGLYWGLRELVPAKIWSEIWRRTAALLRDDPEEWTCLCHFTKLMNYRRQKARTANGEGASKWRATKASPRKHAAQKKRNAEAQRRRRAKLRSIPEAAE